MKNLKLSAFVIVSISLLISACGEEQHSTAPTYNFEKADSLPSGYLEELGIVKTNIEVTAKLYARMNSVGYAYNESVLLSAGKSFSGSSKQALGIGAVGSDLVYAASFAQSQSAMDRMKGLISTAGSLGIGEAFDEELMTKMASDDSTINKSVLLTKAYLKAKDQLFSDERAQLATMMIIGGWIEGLHVSCQMLKTEIKDDEIRIGFWELVNSIENVRHLCVVFKNNAELTALDEQLGKLSDQITPIKKHAKKYTIADVNALADAIATIRNSTF